MMTAAGFTVAVVGEEFHETVPKGAVISHAPDSGTGHRGDQVQLVISKGQLQLADCITNQDVGQNTFDALSSHGHNFGNPSTFSAMKQRISCGLTGARRGIHDSRR